RRLRAHGYDPVVLPQARPSASRPRPSHARARAHHGLRGLPRPPLRRAPPGQGTLREALQPGAVAPAQDLARFGTFEEAHDGGGASPVAPGPRSQAREALDDRRSDSLEHANRTARVAGAVPGFA